MSDFSIQNQEIIDGSSRLVKKEKNFNRIDYSLDNMKHNKAYLEFLKKNNKEDKDEIILEKFKKSFEQYRVNWKKFPEKMYENNIDDYNNFDFSNHGPLCVDIETAAICDLACPHCYREYILTPDKIMKFENYKKIIDEISELKVPSIKLNWRGEPLLNPNINKFIEYAKMRGILEVSINTNATNLNEKTAESLIKSGLDFMIYSFDGGTKQTYEKMRPGRFKKNNFEAVYNNIKNFYLIRKKMGAKFPVTKIQMVLTSETRGELNNFYGLFNNYVDDVTVTPYSERGGNLDDLNIDQKNKIKNYIKKNKLKDDLNYKVQAENRISIENGRKPCEQIFQRLMITYDGRVAMCCMDWGAKHCVGYTSKEGFNIDKTLSDLKRKIESNQKGFELLINAKYPENLNSPKNEVQTLKEIWGGREINKIRNLHKKKQLNQIEICRKCNFKDTYEWKEIK